MTEVLDDTANDVAVIESSGNVFADLNLPCSPEDMMKIEISRAIGEKIRSRKLTQSDAARIIGTDQAKVSNLLRGRLAGFTVERLVRYLLLLGLDVDIRLSEGRPGHLGRVKISKAA